jgi:hypothetical protein
MVNYAGALAQKQGDVMIDLQEAAQSQLSMRASPI